MIQDGVTFPDWPWAPDLNALNDIGTDLLTVAFAALNLFNLGARYDRQYVGHGTDVVEPSKANQLTVVLTELYLGEAGQKLFKPAEGAPGKFAMQTADYEIRLTRPWPRRQGTQPVKASDIDSHRADLWRDGLVVWAALVALSRKGVVPPAGALASRQDAGNGIFVGPMSPKGPSGGEASLQIGVSVQL